MGKRPGLTISAGGDLFNKVELDEPGRNYGDHYPHRA